jgi:Tol biopolymer transport system component
MTAHDEFDRTLAGWIEADALPPVPAGDLERIVDATSRRRPRPAWLAGLGSHWVGDALDAGSASGAPALPLGLRWSTVILVLLMIAALVGAAFVGAGLLERSPVPVGRLGHLAYGLDGDIFIADWDGSHPLKVADGSPGRDAATCDSYWGEGAMWSPNGQYLAYRSMASDACPGSVFISDPEGTVRASFSGIGWIVAWSPDSTRVATWVGDMRTVGIYGVDGKRQALITLPPQIVVNGDIDPVWSPDGGSLLFGRGRVWEVPTDGGPVRVIAASDPRSAYWLLEPSPDGARSAYVQTGSLFVVDAGGQKPRELIKGNHDPRALPAGAPLPERVVWSPTGDRLAFIADTMAGTQLRVVDVANGSVTAIAAISGSGPSHTIAWSPDGDRILFWTADTLGVASLWTIGPYGSDLRQIVQGTSWGDWQVLR